MTRRTTDKLSADHWRTVRFDEIAENIGDRVDPAESDAQRYVGLEHLDSDSLKIRRWGTPDDVIGQKLAFRKGDIIFGRRRAYQRKLAVADFDGICSAHAMVVRAKEDIVDKDYLPFFMQSDMFMERAQEISVGSLSPTINWKTLRVQEFPLPPQDQQRRIAEILWAADRAVVSFESALHDLNRVRSTRGEDFLARLDADAIVPMHELWLESPHSGYSPVPASNETGHFVLSLSALSEGGYRRGQLKPVRVDERVLETRVSKGDLLVSRSNTVDLVGLAGVFDEERDDVSFPDLMMRIVVDRDRIETEFLSLVLLSRQGRRHMQRVAAGTSGSMKKINRKGLGAMNVPCPPIAIQRKFLAETAVLQETMDTLGWQISALRDLRATLVNRLVTVSIAENPRHGAQRVSGSR